MKLIKLQCAYRLRVSQYELQFALLVPLIAVKFSARIVVIQLTALLEYLSDCSIRVFNLDNPPTYNNHGANKTTLQQSYQPRLSFLWPILSLIKTDSISHKQRTSINLTLSAILYGFSSIMAFWQEETARFGLFPSENEIKNRSLTRTMIHSASLANLH